MAEGRTHPLARLAAVLSVAVGGFAGANARYLVELFVPSSLGATATVNVLGCLALGFLLYEEIYGGAISGPSRTLLGTGFLASFTTYSTFVLDALRAEPVMGVAYVAGSYALGFAAVLVGRAAARRVSAAAPPPSGTRAEPDSGSATKRDREEEP